RLFTLLPYTTLFRSDESRFGASSDDEVAQSVGVALGIGLAGAQRLSLFEEPTDLDQELALGRVLIRGSRVGGQIEADDSDAAGVDRKSTRLNSSHV